MKLFISLILALALLTPGAALAADKPAPNIEALEWKVKALYWAADAKKKEATLLEIELRAAQAALEEAKKNQAKPEVETEP